MVLEGAPFLRFEDLGDARASAFGEFQFLRLKRSPPITNT
jgi:hypothetical protein